MALNPLSIFSGPSPLPPQTGTVTGTYAPTQWNQAQSELATGSALTAQGSSLMAGGQSALEMAQKGQLTPEQQAQLDVYTKGLENQALTTYGSLGITPSKSTSYLSTQEDIDTKSLAMAQSFIQSTIALAGTEFTAGGAMFTAGASFTGLGQAAENAATKDLLATAQMQVAQDQAYSQLIGNTLLSIGNIFGKAAAPATGGASTLSSLLPNVLPPSSGAGTQGMGGWE